MKSQQKELYRYEEAGRAVEESKCLQTECSCYELHANCLRVCHTGESTFNRDNHLRDVFYFTVKLSLQQLCMKWQPRSSRPSEFLRKPTFYGQECLLCCRVSVKQASECFDPRFLLLREAFSFCAGWAAAQNTKTCARAGFAEICY